MIFVGMVELVALSTIQIHNWESFRGGGSLVLSCEAEGVSCLS